VRHTLRLPKLGDTVTEVVVTEWYVATGQPIAAGEPLLRVETDKAEVDVPSPVGGVLIEQLARPDDDVPTGAPYAVVEDRA
jgi:2-oxoglutarate dehydrogenase E2 component (dihydrolipoamide succinyltransferase)